MILVYIHTILQPSLHSITIICKPLMDFNAVLMFLNLFNESEKSGKKRGLLSFLSLFRIEFNKFNNTAARMLDSIYHLTLKLLLKNAGPRSAVGNVSGYRCVSDCRSRGREFDPGLVPYFRGD